MLLRTKAEDAVELKLIRISDVADELDRVAEEFESIKQAILDRGDDQPTYMWPVDNSPLQSNSNPTATMRKKKKKLEENGE